MQVLQTQIVRLSEPADNEKNKFYYILFDTASLTFRKCRSNFSISSVKVLAAGAGLIDRIANLRI